ncbi:Mut7-C RNAse domain-containing protein [Desulfomonile tiedjei]|nr:Mut7-C RNAse domain-containing protein [Desulfomonile tiedjei]
MSPKRETELPGEKTHDPDEGFDLDGMLGSLAKWLRILGFDARFPCKKVAQDRYFVTTNRKLKNPQVIKVRNASPIEQLKQILDQTGIVPNSNLFLSRCLSCNVPVREIAKHRIKGRVPDSVFSRNSIFHECPSCGKLYWEGTHASRIKRRLEESGVLAKT